MLFLHPEAAVLQELVAAIASPRQILLFRLFPDLFQICGSLFFAFENTVLEIIDADQIGNICETVHQMLIDIALPFPFRIEQVIPGFGKEFHGHGMDLIDLGSGAVILRDLLASGCHIAFKGMAGFMGQHFGISACLIEVGEDERHLVFCQSCAVAAEALVGSCFQIKQVCLHHAVEEFSGFL